MPSFVIRSRPWAAVLALAAVLLMPVVSWSHARSMLGEMPCATAAMPAHGAHPTDPPDDGPSPSHQRNCCDSCFICTPMVALPPAAAIAVTARVITDLPVAIRPTTTPLALTPAHLLPFPLGPPPAGA